MSDGIPAGGIPGLLADAKRSDLELAWSEREEEAQKMLSEGYDSMAVALRLYSLEIRVKVRICTHLRLSLLPRVCKIHDLQELIIFTGLWEELNDPANVSIKQSWDRLADFSKRKLNELRYSPRNSLPAVLRDELLAALDDPGSGVVPWLTKRP